MEAADHTPMPTAELEARLVRLEGWRELSEAAGGIDAYLVGGAVRDLLRGAGRADLDVVVEGDLGELARRLGAVAAEHARFGTASVRLAGGGHVDIVVARSESYEHPGALPTVEPADLCADLERRDFTINAMAVPIGEEPRLIDPHGGEADLGRGVLRFLHERSFIDDPTRAIRAARYVARLGLQPEPRTAQAISAAELGFVSADRTAAELTKLAAEERAIEALALLETWGLATFEDPSTAALAARMARLEPWSQLVDPAWAVLVAGRVSAGRWRAPAEHLERARELAVARPGTPSAGLRAAAGASGLELLIARARGAEWIDDYLREWRHARLEINGADLIAAGVEQGPAIGRGLSAAHAALLDGAAPDRGAQLDVALRAAGEGEGT